MKNIFKIIRADLRHIKTNVIALCVIIGLTVIPALYSWFNILSNWDPYGQASTSRIKVAVVSVDKGTSLEGTELNVGDTIIDALKTNNTIGWQFVASSDEAIEGVYSGEYYAALVVPENFSKNLISFLSDSMEHPQLKYYCNQKANAIAPKITDKAKTAVQQQVNQTFIDTIVICTMTGLSIVIAGSWLNPELEGVAITMDAFQKGLPFPSFVATFSLMLCLVFFAFTTILGWNYYGERCVEYLFNRNKGVVMGYRILYILAVFIGPYMTVKAVWNIADIFNALMEFPNLIALLALNGVIVKETRDFHAKHNGSY